MQKESADYLFFRRNAKELSKLEDKFGLLIPPIYRSFISVFETINGDVVRLQSDELVTLSYYRFLDEAGKDLAFEGFMDIEDSIENRNNTEEWVENKAMPISNHSHGGTIVIGYSPKNMDKIFFEHDEGLEPIADNIYTFLKDLDFVVNQDFSDRSIYKNWGENFWRIKEEI